MLPVTHGGCSRPRVLSTSLVGPTSETLTQTHGLKPGAVCEQRRAAASRVGGEGALSMCTLCSPPHQGTKLLFSHLHVFLCPHPRDPQLSRRAQSSFASPSLCAHPTTAQWVLQPMPPPTLPQVQQAPSSLGSLAKQGGTEHPQTQHPPCNRPPPGTKCHHYRLASSLTFVWSLANCLSSSRVWVYTRLLYRNYKRKNGRAEMDKMHSASACSGANISLKKSFGPELQIAEVTALLRICSRS